jgi:hypothetical protein
MILHRHKSAPVPAGLLGALLVLCIAYPKACGATQSTIAMIDIGTGANGSAPAEFELQGQWALVRDPTASNGVALQYFGAPAAKDESPLAIYKPAFLKNAEISLRLKPDERQSDRAAGVAVRLRSPQEYYLVQIDARREEIVFSRVKDGVSEEIAGVDADISPQGWHTLTVRVVDNEFTVFFDGQWAFTGFDKALSQPGSVALWTRGNSITRFDDITITPLAVREEIQPGTE